ncbi:MAG: glutamate dehydrogenase [Enterobacterales bacterium]|jgi:glutamate dehydrogenase
MTDSSALKSPLILEKVTKILNKKLSKSKAALVASFSNHFYNSVSEDDLINRDPDELYASILSLWNFSQGEIPAKNGKIRVSNPTLEEHGWQSKHTVIELVHVDMPFMIDSIRMELNRMGLNTHLMISVPFNFTRNSKGQITALEVLYQEKDVVTETPIFIEVDKQAVGEDLELLKSNLQRILDDVHTTVKDWLPMRSKLTEVIAEVSKSKFPKRKRSLDEALDFLTWIGDNNFTFMGYRYYDVKSVKGDYLFAPEPKESYGLKKVKDKKQAEYYLSILPKLAQRMALNNTDLVIISKTSTLSTVHRPAYIDYIGIKRFDSEGNVIGKHRFYGLYTSAAYNLSPKAIPLLRDKVDSVMKLSGLSPKGHDSKVLANLLETYPRDELFQIDVKKLHEITMGILHMQERPTTRLFVRKDPFGRFFSCLVFVPRELYNTELRLKFAEILKRAFGGVGEVPSTTYFSESILARTLIQVNVENSDVISTDIKQLEHELAEAAKSWQESLTEALKDDYGDEQGIQLASIYKNAFPAGYEDESSQQTTVHDIKHLEELSSDNLLSMILYRPQEETNDRIRFKLFNLHEPSPLSDVLPMLENMGCNVLGEVPYEVNGSDEIKRWILDFHMVVEIGESINFDQIKDNFQETFAQVWLGNAENDGFNKLVIAAHLNWRETSMLRAYAKYLLQIGFNLSQSYIEETLAKHPKIVGSLVDLFNDRFKIDGDVLNEVEFKKRCRKIRNALRAVNNLDEDRILSRYIDVISATVRTNYFQNDSNGKPKNYISFKLNPSIIPEIPQPIPMFEIFVYSPRVEGVHLRFGKVARGGLRWSDRREDFRTEVLGLVKAQQVKNSVIVPVGAKGGFFCKQLHKTEGREAFMSEGIDCYKTFIKALLDITDNYADEGIVYPENVIRHDEDDPYLVVAADKGTATFSDIANGIAEEYNFWLGDAFASGGSVGYDHKKMGITARGGWESVKRHFREMGIDCQNTNFTCVAVGDMAGDVFGNGMLLSEHTQLQAAFNHMHIFIDPNPNVATSFKERKRLFELPRSGWDDYSEKLLSKGGGIFLKSSKSIKLTPQMQVLLDTKENELTPNQVINLILKAKVDLLWNGGIGTYVKSATETHSDVGDKANNPVRINGAELRCKVVGEGGNLGMTQRGRIEYMLSGGRANTDFIDNAGGVDCSDKEVNIKILLNAIVSEGDMTRKQRNNLLASMTDEVSEIVLNDCYNQIQSISITERRAVSTLKEYMRFIHTLEKEGRLNRKLEFIPFDDELLERKSKGKGLTRAELSVLVAYGKMVLKEELLVPEVSENPYYQNVLLNYFPKPLRKKYVKEMRNHRLHDEIIATEVANTMVNFMGSNFAYRIKDETGASFAEIANCFSIALEIFDVRTLWQKIQELDNKVPSDVQLEIMARSQRMIRRATRWFLRHGDKSKGLQEYIDYFKGGVQLLHADVSDILDKAESKDLNRTIKSYVEKGVPKSLAKQVTYLSTLFSALDIVEISKTSNESVMDVAELYYKLGAKLELHWFLEQIVLQPVDNHWQAFARSAFREELDWQQRGLTLSLLELTDSKLTPDEKLKNWIGENGELVSRWQVMVADFKSTNSHEFAKFSVALRELLLLVQSCIRLVNQSKS